MGMTLTTSGYIVKYSELTGDPSGANPLAAYAGYESILDEEPVDIFRPVSVSEKIAPAAWVARVEMNLAALDIYPWDWVSACWHDDRIMIIGDGPAATANILFEGFIDDIDWGIGASNSSVIVTAVSYAFRLLRDQEYCVYGRWMAPRTGLPAGQSAVAAVFFNGLRCQFNAGGLPNMYKDRWQDIASAGEVNAGKGGVPLFTYDDDPDALYWTWGDIWDYLTYRYSAFKKWFTDAWSAYPPDYTAVAHHTANVEGMGLWAALASAGDRFGFDVAETIGNDGYGGAIHNILSVKRHGGAQVSVMHQAPGGDGTRPLMDLTLTNMTGCSISENVTSCNVAPIVAGGAKLYEITIPLLPAWDPARLAMPADGWFDPFASAGSPNVNNAWWNQYCKSGGLFSEYASVGRLWDANTDGLYAAPPYGQAVQTIGGAGCTVNVGDATAWPPMPHKALPTISCQGLIGTEGAKMRPFVECCLGGGWFRVPGARILAGRLGCYIEDENLGGIHNPNSINAYGGMDLFNALIAGPVPMRLTCCVESPTRNIILGSRRPTAGSFFMPCEFVDRGALGQIRTQTASSSLHGLDGMGVDSIDDTAKLTDVMSIVQDVQEGLAIEANLPIEWPDANLHLTNCVTQISGINYSLAVCAGANLKYPRIVSIMRMLTERDWQMSIGLTTDRKMPYDSLES